MSDKVMQEQAQAMQALPAAESCRLIDFIDARVVPHPLDPERQILVVTGEKPYLNMRVDLVPRIYIQRPDYWGIEVVGCLLGIGLPVVTPYTVHLDLTGVTGKIGIEVIGAIRSEKIKVRQPALA